MDGEWEVWDDVWERTTTEERIEKCWCLVVEIWKRMGRVWFRL